MPRTTAKSPDSCTADPPTTRASARFSALYVLPARWGSAAASLLMLEGLGRLKSAGCDEVALWTMAAADRARAFYEKSGWNHDGSTQMHDFGDGRERVLLRYVAP